MIIIDPRTIRNAESCIVTDEMRVRRDMREDGKGELVWEFENCGNRTEKIKI